MASFSDSLSPESRLAGDRFIQRIQSGVLQKRTMANHSEQFPLPQASANFDAFLASGQADVFMGRPADESDDS